MTWSAETRSAWLVARRLTPQWAAAFVASWLSVALFAAVTIPLKYPFEAAGQVLDSGVVAGLLVPLAVMSVVLDEGPAHLVSGASRRQGGLRAAFGAGFVVVAAGTAGITAVLAGVPLTLVVVDVTLLAGLIVLGVVIAGTRLGWFLPAGLVAVMSAPGLVPWEVNVLYRVDVGPGFVIGALATVLVAVLALARFGASGVPGRREVSEQLDRTE